jgi:hypothetical protein
MIRGMAVVTAGLAAAGLALLPVATASAAPAAVAPVTSVRLPVVHDCDGWQSGQVRTHVVLLDCLGQVVLKTYTWRWWTAHSARTRRAELYVDSCTPSCASGTYRHYAATVVFYRPRTHDGVRYFSRLQLRYFHQRRRDYTYAWAAYPGAQVPGWIGGP